MTVEQYIEATECGTCHGAGVVTDMRSYFDAGQMAYIADPIEVPCENCDGTGEK